MSDEDSVTPPPAEEEKVEEEKTQTTAGSVKSARKPSWEKELVKRLEVTWGDAKAILQIAKDDLGIDQKDYPEEKKDEVFAKCDEIGESFEKTPRVSVSAGMSLKKAATVDSEESEEGEPEPKTWEEEIKAEYDCSLVDATTLLHMAKHDLEIDEKEYPEDQKEVVMAKVKELSDGFDFATAPEPTTIVFVRDPWADQLSKELGCRISNAKQLLLLAKRDLGLPEDEPSPVSQKAAVFEKAREIAKSYDLTPRDEVQEEVDNNQLIVAIIIALFVIAAIVGVSVGVTRNNRNKETPDATEAPAPTPGTSIDPDCEQIEKQFSVPGVMVGMAVSADISEVEINYAASVLQKTYTSLVQGAIENATDFCDPFCRTVTGVEVVDWEVVPDVNGTYLEEGCDSELDVLYEVSGTFVGCEDTEWPGLIDTPALRRQLSAAKEEIESFLRGGLARWLQEDLCGACPDDSSSLGNVIPTGDDIIETLDPFVSVLPSICAVTDFVVVESGMEVFPGAPPEGGWSPVNCTTSIETETCSEFMEAFSGQIPCDCDGKCIQIVDGAFASCNDSGEVNEEGATGEVRINAAGCTFAEDASDIEGFTCAP
ncbi:MAG: hypothetical protein SGILL_008004 [Bacillariaceae sp.]